MNYLLKKETNMADEFNLGRSRDVNKYGVWSTYYVNKYVGGHVM